MQQALRRIFKRRGDKASLDSSVPRESVGLFVLSNNDQQSTIDVVAVHGLQGGAYKTFRHDNGYMWLEEFLPVRVPFARIMTFGYESTVAFGRSVAKIEDKSLDLLHRLSTKRATFALERRKSRPIVFIGHSLGGILIKKALILAHERSSDPDFRDILDNTRAIAFLGVPHNGADSAWWASLAANALKAASIGTSTNPALVADIQKDSSPLINISKQFVDRGRNLIIYTFYETQRLAGVVVVNDQSARIGVANEKLFPVEENHRGICKFPSADSSIVEAVGVWIVKLIESVAQSQNANPHVQGAGHPMIDAARFPKIFVGGLARD